MIPEMCNMKKGEIMKTFNIFAIVSLAALIIAPAVAFAFDAPGEVWVRTWGLGNDDWGEDVAVDNAGNVYVVGNHYDGSANNWETLKYDADGNLLWSKEYDSGGDDMVSAVDVDIFGNVYVVGWTEDGSIHDWRYIKYDWDGNLLWNKIRDWGGDVDNRCHDVVIAEGNIMFMVGDYIHNGTWDYLTVKCDLDGTLIGENGWSGGGTVNNNGSAIALDPAGYIYVAGTVYNATADWGIVKYNASNLNLVWNMVFDSGADDHLPSSSIAVDDNTGDVYAVGWVDDATIDWEMVKYNSAGAQQWYKINDWGNNEGAWGVEVDTAGDVYVNGDYDAGGTEHWNSRTMKYDPDGNVIWGIDYNYIDNDAGRGITLDDSGYVYVVGHSFRTSDVDFLTIKYTQNGTGIEGNSGTAEVAVSPNPFTDSATISFAVISAEPANISVYSMSGRLVKILLDNESLDGSTHSIQWNGVNANGNRVPPGVYLCRFTNGDTNITRRMVMIR